MCDKATYNNVLAEIAQYRAMKKEIEGILNQLEDEVKDYMRSESIEELIGEEHTATYKAVTSKRLDTKALKLDMPKVYDKYAKVTTTERFNFS